MSNTARKTVRQTHSESITSGVGVRLPTNVDPALIWQARIDCANDALWTAKRASYRTTLARHLLFHQNSGLLSQRGQEAVAGIVGYNNWLRMSTPYDPAAPTLEIPNLVQLAEIDDEVGEPWTEPPPDSSAPDSSAPDSSAIGVPLAAAVPPDAPTLFNPPLPAAYIAQGWGFVTGTIVQRLRSEYADFPAPIAAETNGDRKTHLWRYSDIATWSFLHQDAISQARSHGSRTRGAREKTAAAQAEEIARLRAELAAARNTRGVQ